MRGWEWGYGWFEWSFYVMRRLMRRRKKRSNNGKRGESDGHLTLKRAMDNGQSNDKGGGGESVTRGRFFSKNSRKF